MDSISEKQIFAMMLNYQQKAYSIVSQLPKKIFDDMVLQEAFAIYKDMMAKHGSVDVLALRNELVKRGISESDATLFYLDFAKTMTPYFSAALLEQLYENYRMREFRTLAYKIIDGLYMDVSEVEQDVIAWMNETKIASDAVSIADVDIYSRTNSLYKTGVDIIDNTLSGLFGGQLVCIAGRPSMGKSTLALQIAKQAARAGTNVLLSSLESTEYEIMYRILASETGIPVYRIMSGNISQREKMMLDETIEAVKAQMQPLLVLRKYSLDDILFTARSVDFDKYILIIDYLQIMRIVNRKRSRVEEIGDITRTLKLFAMEHDVPVVILSQLNRGADGSVPKLSDLRDSGTIEQDSDIVIFIHKDDKRSSKAQIIFAKARDAAVSFMDVYHDTKRYTFSCIEEQYNTTEEEQYDKSELI